MRILVIDKSVFGGQLANTDDSLVKHLEFWRSGNNQVDLLAQPDKDLTGRLKEKINLLKLPPKVIFFSVFYVYFRLLLTVKKYDLVIEVWGDKPLFPLFWNSKRSLIAIFERNFKAVLPGKLMYLIYGKAPFLVNSSSAKEKLIGSGIDVNSIKLIPDGFAVKKKVTGAGVVKRKNIILIVGGKDVNQVLSLISLIERKSLEWKFVTLIDKSRLDKFKKLYSSSDFSSSVKVMVLSTAVFNKNIKDSKFVIITKDLKNISDFVETSLYNKTPVFLDEASNYFCDTLNNVVLRYESPMDLAEKINSISKKSDEYKKLQNKISRNSKAYSWKDVGKMSLKYLESL